MTVEGYPNLLMLTKLVKPIDLSINFVQDSKEQLNSEMHKIFIQGVFVLSVSSMEVMISDVLRYYLINFPQKIPNSDFSYSKNTLFGNQFNLIEKTVENHINTLSYKSFEDYFKKLLEHLSIEWSEFQEFLGNDLQEIKATRNLLLHNNLVKNDQYSQIAGSAVREVPNIGYDYAIRSIEKILEFEKELKKHVAEKYKEYTKINANKRLWKYMFKTPLMASYDDYWHYDESDDSIYALKKCEREDGLSGSETMLLELWRNHFNGSQMKYFNMKHIVGATREKAMFFLSIAGEFSFG